MKSVSSSVTVSDISNSYLSFDGEDDSKPKQGQKPTSRHFVKWVLWSTQTPSCTITLTKRSLLHLWEHNTIAAHKEGDCVRQLQRHTRKNISTLFLLFQVQNQRSLKSSTTWSEFDLSKNYKTVHCINYTNQLHISNIYTFLELQRFWFLISEAFKCNY